MRARALGLCGLIALGFGAGSYYATHQLGAFQIVNLALGTLALVAAALLAARSARPVGAPALRRVLTGGLLRIVVALIVAVAAERAADFAGLRSDWSFEGRFQLSEATERALASLSGRVDATLYAGDADPRIRATRLLLENMAETGHLRFDERPLGESPEDEDRYAIPGPGSVVVRVGERFETVERPTEGSLYEALERLRAEPAGLLYATRGAGEGDLEDTGPSGFSGLAAALATEGYRVHALVMAATDTLPEDADGVLTLAPRRRLRDEALDAFRTHLARGGGLVAFLEPGVNSGIEEVLAEWGLASPDAVVVDPASGPLDGSTAGVNPIAFHYSSRHPLARGLDAGRMTFFRGARSFHLRKPEVGDELDGIVFASSRSWLATDPDWLRTGGPASPPEDARQDYHPLVVASRHPRDGRETRIVAFGDVDMASNRHLRTLYNLDLVMNAVHWALAREPAITLRPKAVTSGRLQLALPLENTLVMFQGVGLLVPELFVLAAAITWLRGRGA